MADGFAQRHAWRFATRNVLHQAPVLKRKAAVLPIVTQVVVGEQLHDDCVGVARGDELTEKPQFLRSAETVHSGVEALCPDTALV